MVFLGDLGYLFLLLNVFVVVAKGIKCFLPVYLQQRRTKKGSLVHTFLSYQLVSLSMVTYCTFLGVYGMICEHRILWQDRLGTYSNTAGHLIDSMRIYQLWNCLLSLCFPEYRNLQTLSHHGAVVLLTYIIGDYGHFYMLFFLGISEISSGFHLHILDINKHLPGLINDNTIRLYKTLFFISFVLCRIVLWTTINSLLWYDLCIQNTYQIKTFCFLFLSTFFTGLQYKWGHRLYQLWLNR